MKFRLFLVALAISYIQTFAVIIPDSLQLGDKVGIITPSSAVDAARVTKLSNLVSSYGLVPVVAPHAKGRHGSYAANEEVRAREIMEMFRNPEIKAIISTRGGHGAIHMLQFLDPKVIHDNPKWLVGFSDVTTLHALMKKAGVASIHGPMSEMYKHTGQQPVEDEFAILFGDFPPVKGPKSSFNQAGEATGRIYGGNFITFNELAETDIDMLGDLEADGGVILFIEEINEKLSAIERMMFRLHRSGKLKKVKGLVFGHFSGCGGDADFSSINSMLSKRLQQWGYVHRGGIPIAFNVPVGHGWPNYPIIEGAKVRLTVDANGSSIVYVDANGSPMPRKATPRPKKKVKEEEVDSIATEIDSLDGNPAKQQDVAAPPAPAKVDVPTTPTAPTTPKTGKTRLTNTHKEQTKQKTTTPVETKSENRRPAPEPQVPAEEPKKPSEPRHYEIYDPYDP